MKGGCLESKGSARDAWDPNLGASRPLPPSGCPPCGARTPPGRRHRGCEARSCRAATRDSPLPRWRTTRPEPEFRLPSGWTIRGLSARRRTGSGIAAVWLQGWVVVGRGFRPRGGFQAPPGRDRARERPSPPCGRKPPFQGPKSIFGRSRERRGPSPLRAHRNSPHLPFGAPRNRRLRPIRERALRPRRRSSRSARAGAEAKAREVER